MENMHADVKRKSAKDHSLISYLKLSLKRIYVITHGIQQETAVKLKNVMSNT